MDFKDLYLRAKKELLEGDVKVGIELAEAALQAARESGNREDIMFMLYMIAEAAIFTNNQDLARQRLDESVEIVMGMPRTDHSCWLAINCIDLFLGLGDTAKAKKMLFEHVFVDDTSQESLDALSRIGLCFLGEGEPTKAIVYFKELHDRARSAKNAYSQAHGLLLQARTYAELGDYAQAINLLDSGWEIALKNNQPQIGTECTCELAYVYSQVGFHSKALAIITLTLGFLSDSKSEMEATAKATFDTVHAWSNANYSYLLKEFTQQTDDARTGGFTRVLLKTLANKAVALNGLQRYKEAQEIVWEIFDAINGRFSQYWLSTEQALNELATALQGLNYTEQSAKARSVSQRAFQIRIDRSIPYAKKVTLLEQLAEDMKEVITFLRLRRVPVIRYRGRVIDMKDGSFTIDGIKSDEHLTKTEREIIEGLWVHRGTYFKDDAVVGFYQEGEYDQMTTNKRKAFVHVSNINIKLKDNDFIESESGKGYRIAP